MCLLVILLFSVTVTTYFADIGRHFLFQTENELHKSSCTEVYYQIGMQSTESNMLLELLAQIISEPCFNVLRTQQQLGYIVFSGVHKINVMQGLKVLVQSDKHPQYIEKRIDSFVDSMLVSMRTFNNQLTYLSICFSSFLFDRESRARACVYAFAFSFSLLFLLR